MVSPRSKDILQAVLRGKYLRLLIEFTMKRKTAHIDIPALPQKEALTSTRSELETIEEAHETLQAIATAALKSVDEKEEYQQRNKRRKSTVYEEVEILERQYESGDPESDNGNALVKRPIGYALQEHLVTFRSPEGGELSTAMTLTERFLDSLNFIFRTQAELSATKGALAQVIEKGDGIWARVCELQPLEVRSDEENTELTKLEEALAECTSQRQLLEEHEQKLQGNLPLPQSEVFGWLRRALEKGGLLQLDEVEHSVKPDPNWQPPTPSSPVTPTTSETHIKLAEETIHNAIIRLQNAQDKHDHWQAFYREQLGDYRRAVDQDNISTTRSEFDRCMVILAREATGELIEAEQAYDDAKKQAKALGLVTREHDQTSGFEDGADDGYRESMEADWVADVNTGGIIRWMEGGHMASGDINEKVEVDEWEAKSIELCDSISMVATDKEKTKINRWRSICEQVREELPVLNEN